MEINDKSYKRDNGCQYENGSGYFCKQKLEWPGSFWCNAHGRQLAEMHAEMGE